MVALKLQQFQHNLKKNRGDFPRRLWRLVFPMLFGLSDGGGIARGGDFKGDRGHDCHPSNHMRAPTPAACVSAGGGGKGFPAFWQLYGTGA